MLKGRYNSGIVSLVAFLSTESPFWHVRLVLTKQPSSAGDSYGPSLRVRNESLFLRQRLELAHGKLHDDEGDLDVLVRQATTQVDVFRMGTELPITEVRCVASTEVQGGQLGCVYHSFRF